MKRFLVTGGTGFLGSHLLDRLLAQTSNAEELRIRVLARSTLQRDHPCMEFFQGDVRNAEVVDRAVTEVNGIFHLAGFVSRNPRDASLLFDTHIQGTRNVCESALRHGAQRVVLASSSGTIAASRYPVMHNEDSPYAVEIAANWPYYLSKIYQEKLALSYVERGLAVVVVNPSLLLGPGDDRMSSIGDVDLYMKRRIPSVPSGGMNFVDVRDAADALIAAMERGTPGRRYLVGGYNMLVREFLGRLERITGIKPPGMELPESWSRLGVPLLRTVYGLAGKQFPLDDATIEMSYRFWYFDSSRARSELGFSPRPAEETLRDTVQYLHGRGRS